jgi:hypothetical protein
MEMQIVLTQVFRHGLGDNGSGILFLTAKGVKTGDQTVHSLGAQTTGMQVTALRRTALISAWHVLSFLFLTVPALYRSAWKNRTRTEAGL